MDPTTTGSALGSRTLKRADSVGRHKLNKVQDALFSNISRILAFSVVIIIAFIGVELFAGSALTRGRYGPGFLTTVVWDVPHEVYGSLPFIFGTLVSSALSLLLAVPFGVGSALFLSEIAPKWLAEPVSFVIELLAAIPSIIYGLWGFLVMCPWMQAHVSPWLARTLGANPVFAGPPVLTNMLAAGMILAVMILPIITSVSKEVFRAVPRGLRESSIGLGATKWETIRHIVLPSARSGVTGAVMLGLGRAVGETMAVVMVIGNTPKIAASILQPGYTMPALLANQFNEAYNDEIQRSALIEVALILFVVTVLVNALARGLLLLTAQNKDGGKSKSKSLEAFRTVLDFAGKYTLTTLVSVVALTQIALDFRAHGTKAVSMPFELIVFAVLAVRFGVPLALKSKAKTKWRSLTSKLSQVLLGIVALMACCVFGIILAYVISQGIRGLSLNLFTELPRPPGVEGGGLKNAIFGTIELVAIASVIGIPIGLLGGIFLADDRQGKLVTGVRFCADVLNGIPSVVIGLFAYTALVLPVKHFSAWAGGCALAIMLVPTVMRTTEEMIRLVPREFNEGALALGSTRFQSFRKVILPAAKNGILTGVMLGLARILGETAPLLFTAFGNDELNVNPSAPVSSLTMKIYQYAISPYDDWVAQAWAGALILLALVLGLNLTARFARSRAVQA